MKAKIIKCSSPLYWYRYAIGKVYEVEENIENPFNLRVKGTVIGNRYIQRSDCLIEDFHDKLKAILKEV